MTKRKIDPDSAVTESSGNVFTDLGFAPGAVPCWHCALT